MSLTSSLYAGTSGLSNTGNALQVTSNNISNINTLGFKKGTATFADTLYQTMGTNAGTSQVGLGMNVDNVAQVFTDGSLETTSNATDLAIGGDGFFVVSEFGSEESYYTRAGNFSFDQDGALVTSEGYILQGWYVESDTGDELGAVTDLILTEFTSPPDDTEEITVITNLDADADPLSTVLSNVFEYDEEDGTTMNSDGYEYQTVVTVYDSLGSPHEVTVYYDKKSDTEWQYVITCDPDEDKRTLVADTDSTGLLARGTISFSESSGKIVSMNMEEFTGMIGNVDVTGNNSLENIHFEIENSDAIQLDGYGFNLSYNGTDWSFVTPLPANYDPGAAILPESNATNIYIDLDADGETDLKIYLDEEPTNDNIAFDINDPGELHIQDIKNVAYSNIDSNTTLTINDAGVMTTSVEDITIAWDANSETWSWNTSQKANDAGVLISIDEGDYEVKDATAMTMVAEDVSLYWDAVDLEWKWNEELKDNDITVDTVNTILAGDITPDVTVKEPGSEGAAILAGDYTLTWNVVAGDWDIVGPGGTDCTVTNTTDIGCELIIEDTVSGDSSTIKITLDGAMDILADPQSIAFTIESTPPEEYAAAQILSGPAPDPVSDANNIFISFDGDVTEEDLKIFDVDGGTDPNFSFDVDPRPPQYSNATLSGDATYCSIDLDGSGNDDDKEDIIFTFEDALAVDGSITFDIEGSTAWRTVTTDEAEETGYYQFTADFLGGEFGATETDISFNIGSKFDGNNWVNDSLSSTHYAKSSSTTYQDADGYASGDLTGIEVAPDGLVTGSYSNGQGIALFKIALADFNNVNGLRNMGGNLYQSTGKSGAAITNKPGENGLGTLSSYALEMSNVDISEEFVDMIGLQTAYEANAKIITTVDEMMNTVIGMKR